MAQIVEANIKFEIPADKVLVDRIEWETTKKKAEAHEIWKMDDLKNYMLNKSTQWITANVLANHTYTNSCKNFAIRERLVAVVKVVHGGCLPMKSRNLLMTTKK